MENKEMTFFEELQWRGLVQDISSPDLIDKLNNGGLTFYIGTDPTADSLHVGHMLVFLFAKRLESVGNKPIFLIGGATASIGDPKPGAERQLLSRETIDHNASCLFNQVSKLFPAQMVNNYDWTHNIDILTFLRTYGKFFNVNYMINKETVKARLDSGISYAEFSYQILQALDFEHLYREKGCMLQIGGQDQWGNITSGLELIRKIHGADAEAYGVTVPLFTKSDGTKFGKSEGGAVWLDPEKTSPYAFYQFWINTPDNDVMRELKQFTFLSKEEIEELEIVIDETTQKKLKAAKSHNFESATLYRDKEHNLREQLEIAKRKWDERLSNERETVDEDKIAEIREVMKQVESLDYVNEENSESVFLRYSRVLPTVKILPSIA